MPDRLASARVVSATIVVVTEARDHLGDQLDGLGRRDAQKRRRNVLPGLTELTARQVASLSDHARHPKPRPRRRRLKRLFVGFEISCPCPPRRHRQQTENESALKARPIDRPGLLR